MPTSVPSLRRRPRIAPNGRSVSRRSPTLSMIQCKLAMWVSCVRIPLDHVNTSAKVGAHSHELFSPVAGLLFEIHRWRGARHKQIIWPTHNKDSRLLRDKRPMSTRLCVCVCAWVVVGGVVVVAVCGWENATHTSSHSGRSHKTHTTHHIRHFPSTFA